MPTFEEIKARASLPETTVTLIVDGKHLERIRDLEAQLRVAQPPTSLAERNPATVLAEEIADLQEEMRDSVVAFKLRAMGGRRWDRFKFTQPQRAKDEDEDAFSERFFLWLCVLVSITCIDPVMTAEEVAELVDLLPGSSWDELSSEAWALNSGKVSIPFSAAAFGLTTSSGGTSRRPSSSESRTPGSSAKSAPKRRRTSTTPKGG